MLETLDDKVFIFTKYLGVQVKLYDLKLSRGKVLTCTLLFCLEDNRKHVHGAVGYVAGPSGLESLKATFHRLIVFIRNLQA